MALSMMAVLGASAHAETVTVESASVADPPKQENELPTAPGFQLPFDYPFTLSLSYDGLELEEDDPILTYHQLEEVGSIERELCKWAGNETLLASVTSSRGSGTPVSTAKFIMPALEPNKFFVLCLESPARIPVTLDDDAAKTLDQELRSALWTLQSEISGKDRDDANEALRNRLEGAAQQYARHMGMTGKLRLRRGLVVDDLLTNLIDVRNAMAPCDRDILAENLKDAEKVLPSVANQRQDGSDRMALEDCRALYDLAFEGIASVRDEIIHNAIKPEDTHVSPPRTPPDSLTEDERKFAKSFRDSTLDTLRDPIELLSQVEGLAQDFVTNAFEKLSTKNSVVLASTVVGESEAGRYFSGDTGVAYVPALDRTVGYQGFNIYLRPVNPTNLTPLGYANSAWTKFKRRFAFTFGLTITDGLEQKELIDGGDANDLTDDRYLNVVQNWEDEGSILVGFGYRLTPALRMGAGAIAYRQLEDLVDLELSTKVSYYVSISLDVNLRSLFRNNVGGLFSGGSPTPAAVNTAATTASTTTTTTTNDSSDD